MPQINYDFPADLGLPGTWAEAYGVQEARSYALEEELSTWTATIDDPVVTGEVFSFDIIDVENGVNETVEFTVGATQTDDATAAGLAADANANPDLIAPVTVLAAANVVTVAARTPGQSIDLANAATDSAAGTITLAETVVPGDADVVPGLAVVLVSDGIVRLPTTGDTPEDILGCAMRSESTIDANTGEPGDTNPYRAGAVIPVARKGPVWVEPEGAVTAGGRVFVRISGTGVIGSFAGADDGADRIELDNAEWLTDSRTVNGKTRAKLMLNRPE